MFIGFPPSAKKSYYHNEFSISHFLVIAAESAKKLEWRIDSVTDKGFAATDMDKSGNPRCQVEFKIANEKATITSRSSSGFIDFGRNASNIRKFNETLIDLKYDLKPEELDHRYNDLKKQFQADTTQESTEETLADEGKTGKSFVDFVSLFVPKKGYLVTPVLININILRFIIQVISGVSMLEPSGESLIYWGGNFRPVVFSGQWWRLLTNCFLHIGIIHLLMNMYALMYIGVLLEPIIGSKRFGFAYLVSGILASVTSFCWHENTISAGASGAIFGMYGVFAALLTTNLIDRNVRKAQLTSIGIFIFYNLAYGMKGGIDNAAHIGGLVSGIVTGFAFYPMLKNTELRRMNLLLNSGLVLVFVCISVFFISRSGNPIGEYSKILEPFADLEQKALSPYRMDMSAGDEKLLREIESNALPNWIKCKNLVDSAGKVKGLPEVLVERNALLTKYCDYRIESSRLMMRSINEKSIIHRFAFDQYNEKIDLIIRKLNGEQVADSLLEVKVESSPLSEESQKGIIVLNGFVVNNIDFLDQTDIKEMSILKGEEALALYGEKARYGVIIINTYSPQ